MRYVHHNFFSNFLGGVKSGDVDLTIDLWVNEVSDLVVHNTNEVVALLNKTGVKTENTDSYEQIIDKILDNINSNKLLNKGISFLIGEQNNITPEKNKEWKKIIDSIGDKYESLFKSTLGNEKIKASIKSDLMKHIKSKSVGGKDGKKAVFKSDTVEAKRKRNIKIALYVLGGVAVFTALYYGIEYYKKSKMSGMSFENGGNMPATPPAPIAPIAPAITPPAPIPAPAMPSAI